MIQRIQTLYLLIAALLSIALFYIPLFELPEDPANAAAKTFTVSSNSVLLILNAAIGIFSFSTVFFFKNRTFQMKACRLVLILTFFLIGLLFYTSDTFSTGLDHKVVFKIGTYIPLIQVVMIFLAHRSIRKDEALVRSADRLR